jgi:TetR/AcrR family transcriptional repressor of nem operon
MLLGKRVEQMSIVNVELTQILDAPLRVIRIKGYGATRIEDLCEVSGLTKGNFCHHGSRATSSTLRPFKLAHRLDRMRAYVDFGNASCAASRLNSPVPLVQWRRRSLQAIRSRATLAVSASVTIGEVEADIAQAIAKYGIGADWSARSLAFCTQAVIQDGFILANTQNGVSVAADCLDQLRRYLELLFKPVGSKEKRHVEQG